MAFIDAHREADRVEPICRVLQITPSSYYALTARAADATKRPARAPRDAVLRPAIARVWHANKRAVRRRGRRPPPI